MRIQAIAPQNEYKNYDKWLENKVKGSQKIEHSGVCSRAVGTVLWFSSVALLDLDRSRLEVRELAGSDHTGPYKLKTERFGFFFHGQWKSIIELEPREWSIQFAF